MPPVAVHPSGAVSVGVEDAGTDSWGVALGREDSDAPEEAVVDGDAARHPLSARSKAVLARIAAKRWVVRSVMSRPTARAVQFGRGRSVRAAAANHQHVAIEQQRGCVATADRDDRPGGGAGRTDR